MGSDDRTTPAAPVAEGTIVVRTAPRRRGALVRVEPPDRPWQYAAVTSAGDTGGDQWTAVLTGVPAGTCWVHLEGADGQNARSGQVTVPAGGVVELDWRE
jgi:hypothetical protein